jgi:exosortase C (VPDSG-CTERM-specific)
MHELTGRQPVVDGAAPESKGQPLDVLRNSAWLRRRLSALLVLSGLLLSCFVRPLFSLIQFASQSDLYSYILLVPFVSLYLIWVNRHKLLVWDCAPRRPLAVIPFLAGLGILGGYHLAAGAGWRFALDDYLCATTLSLIFFLQACAILVMGWGLVRQVAFPAAFLFFMVPLPAAAHTSIETFLQNGSAAVAYGLLSVSGMPVLRHGNSFELPGFRMEVAPECSGIHSTFVLFITSCLAGYFFLRSPWRRAALALAVIPLALLRNGFRVFVIAQLCVRIGPEMIDSFIHRKGGPIFFILSLIPFSLVLWVLRKSDTRLKPSLHPSKSLN